MKTDSLISAKELIDKIEELQTYCGNRHPNTNCLLVTKGNILRLIHKLIAETKKRKAGLEDPQ